MLLNLRYFLLIIIVIASCKHSDTPSPQHSPSKCQVIEFQVDYGSDSDAFVYLYDEKSILKVVTGSRDINIERNNDGQIKGVDWFRNGTPEFFYNSQGRLEKIVSARGAYEFFEYDSKGHLSQSTWFPDGDHGLETMYNPNFEAFVSAAISKFNTVTDYSKKESFVRGLGLTICTKYLVDEKGSTVSEFRNMISTSPGHKFGDRVEELWVVTKYDGKNSPYNSADWRPISIYINKGSLNDDRFPELGNVLEKTSKFSGFSGDNCTRSYVYNEDGYPISGRHIDKNLDANLNLTWRYNCK
ncbi:hypothetical protein SAMN05216327_110101 [Dyadobacter sp. SG02]|uniref:hypothetical protein n=1 Tax=Dyadobacter sp. SG02 TaxID=1855291 RepID=UPI0008C3471F|nr:hypothetical protein [Dyadobacter sp. SG02]SEJ43730.1 hypothetical protein SAMN05216327_110101 [Dyadobacter sp. SG02]